LWNRGRPRAAIAAAIKGIPESTESLCFHRRLRPPPLRAANVESRVRDEYFSEDTRDWNGTTRWCLSELRRA